MKIKLQITLFALIIFILGISINSCNDGKIAYIKTKDFKIRKNGKTYIIGSLYVDNYFSLAILKYDSLQIVFSDLSSGEILKEVNLNKIFTLETLKKIAPCRFFIQNTDSIFIGLDDNIIFLLNGNGDLQNKWDLNLYTHSKFELELVYLPFLPLVYFDNTLYIGNASNDYIGDEDGRSKYFETVIPSITFNLITLKLKGLPIKFPEIYQKGKDYRSYHISQCITETNNIYSFSLEH